MAGYSATPLPQKLGIQPGHRVALLQAPPRFVLTNLPLDVTLLTNLRGKQPLDVILFFTDSQTELQREFAGLADRLTEAGGLWVAWPKKSSKVPTDLTEDRLRDIGLPLGLVDVKVCAVDETWSGLRFVWRKELRAARKRASPCGSANGG